MKSLIMVGTAVLSLTAAPGGVVAQTVTGINITFQTTRDDKDGDTQVRDRIYSSGQDLATLYCCSAGKNSSDHWNDPSSNTRSMSIVGALTKTQLDGAAIDFGEAPNGNDTWIFIPTVSATFSDGTTQQWTFREVVLVNGGAATCHFSSGSC